jgi:hypothetical protein
MEDKMLEQIIKNEDLGYLRLLVDIINSDKKDEKRIVRNYPISN